MSSEVKSKCFIITPIGDDNDPIRRHIDGIIDAAIIPALGEKYEIVVAHRIYEPGSITKQIISEIYNDCLVVANVTNRNPNVMYELALRHAIGKPVITIAEKGTSLPSDIIMQRAIFYHNDAKGVLELKEELVKAESEIDFEKTSGPIFEVLGDISRDTQIIQKATEENHGDIEPLKYILERLDRIEHTIKSTNEKRHSNVPFDIAPFRTTIAFSYEDISHQTSPKTILNRLSSVKKIDGYVDVVDVKVNPDERIIAVMLLVSDTTHMPEVYQYCYKILSECGFKKVTLYQ